MTPNLTPKLHSPGPAASSDGDQPVLQPHLDQHLPRDTAPLGLENPVGLIAAAGGNAEYIPAREDCGLRIAEIARGGDRIVIMGACDDTLSLFARNLLEHLR